LSYVADTLASFKIAYTNGLVFDVFGEIFWNFTAKDRLIGKANINMNSMRGDYYLTYTPVFKVSSTYHRTMFTNLRAFATFEFTGTQNTCTNPDNNYKLDPYVMLNLGAD